MGNVIRDFTKSGFKYETDNFIFVFSSDFNLKRFEDKAIKMHEKLKIEMKSRFGMEISLYEFCCFAVYKDHEKRGFRVLGKNGEVIEWLKNLRLDGEIKTLKNCSD